MTNLDVAGIVLEDGYVHGMEYRLQREQPGFLSSHYKSLVFILLIANHPLRVCEFTAGLLYTRDASCCCRDQFDILGIP